ncbi:MAG TPA: lysozyme inhibitor LprI family protein [Brevundimonas sp.]|jgi:uncharacterized protein YecT (DUF1311 family)|uniref:lysozyme inhibitor LprI family protein n=1 Tax=Brevundimonas sp. TaxID=1871086 RepID=UPI002E111DC9|nr:lysozyme inhibitor LprI family protein [Brevundimonas sp.]
MLIAALLASTVAVAGPDGCEDAVSTVDISACLSGQLERESDRMDSYFAAVIARADELGDRIVGADGPEVVEALQLSQSAWLAYRDAECSATYAWWSDGTIRGPNTLQCRIDLTRERTRHLWSAYLTHADSSPPVLPEPSSPAP